MSRHFHIATQGLRCDDPLAVGVQGLLGLCDDIIVEPESPVSGRHRGRRRQQLPDWIRQEDEEVIEIIMQIVLSGVLD